ncbi:MAG: HD domain-containing protein [Candidatus Omnitrophica bacterium]|nr:HD domain-containing protein [Candidatus Omnitrophota bacterium]
MVRFINIIDKNKPNEDEGHKKQSQKVNITDAIKRSQDSSVDDRSQNVSPSSEVQRRGNGRDTATYQSDQTGVDQNLKNMYDELLHHAAAVCTVLEKFKKKQTIFQEDIEPILEKIVTTFLNNLYNDLLLRSYSYTKKDYLCAHIVNTCLLSIGFGAYLNFSKEDLIELGKCSFYHDIGMIFYRNIYRSRKKLHVWDFRPIKRHPSKSIEALHEGLAQRVRMVISDVHEREEGQGYPKGKKGARISQWSKLIALADVFEALTHSRSYREARTPFEAIKMIIEMKTAFFEESYIKKFVEFLSIYPVGSIVHLSTGDIALVIAANNSEIISPVVKTLVNPNNPHERRQEIIDLSKDKSLYIKGPADRDEEHDVLVLFKPRGEAEVSI